MHRQQDQRLAGQHERQGAEGCDRQVDRQGVGQGAVQVGVHAAPQGDRLHQIGKAVVEQHQISGFARHGGAAPAHGHADVGGLEGRRIVNSIAGHRHHGTARLQGPHQLQLLSRHHPGEHIHLAHPLRQHGGTEALQIGAAEHRARRQARLVGDRAGGGGPIAGDHHHPQPGLARLNDGGGHLRAQRIGQPQEAQWLEGEVVHPHRRLAGVQEWLQLAMKRRPIQPAGHRQHPQALGRQGIGGLQESGRGLALQVAEIGDRLRCPLGGDVAAAVAIAPELGEHQQLTAEGVLPLQRPIRMEVLALAELLRRQPLNRQLHRIHRIAAAGQHGQLQQPVPGLLQR